MFSRRTLRTSESALFMLRDMSRGRPLIAPVIPIFPNRLREARLKQGLTQEDLSAGSGYSMQHISEVERYNRRLTPAAARRFAAALGVTAGELTLEPISEAPLLYWISAFFTEGRPECYELAEPHLLLSLPPSVAVPGCFAAQLFDRSADREFPAGSILFFRPIRAGDLLHDSMRVLVRFFDAPVTGAPNARRTREILYGHLDISAFGHLTLVVRSTDPAQPDLVRIQGATEHTDAGLAEAATPLFQRSAMPYCPTTGERDGGIILGELIWFGRKP